MVESNFQMILDEFDKTMTGSDDEYFYNKQSALVVDYFHKFNENVLSDKDKYSIEKQISNYFKDYTFYSRDINLNNKLLNNYKVGNLLYSPGELFFTPKKIGLNKSHRFLLVSNKMTTRSLNDEGNIVLGASTDFCSTYVGECYKIIDIYEKDNKTQITLLNYPSAFEKLFKSHQTIFEKELIPEARKYFDESLKEPELNKFDSEKLLYYFENPVGLCPYDKNLKKYSKEAIISILGILGSIEDKFGFGITMKFIEHTDVDYFTYLVDESVIKVFGLLKSDDEINKLEVYDTLIHEHENIISAAIKKRLLNQKLDAIDEERYNNWTYYEKECFNYITSKKGISWD